MIQLLPPSFVLAALAFLPALSAEPAAPAEPAARAAPVAPAAARDSAAQDSDPGAVADFRAQFKKLKAREDRIEAVLTLKGNEAPEVVDALAPVLTDADAEIVRAAIEVLASFRTEPPVSALAKAFEASSSSVVRAGLLQASSLGKYPLPDKALQKCLRDRDWSLRRGAVNAIAARAAEGAAELVAPLCADGEPAVRSAALEGLSSLRAESVLAPAREALADESWQVRSSAAMALGRVRHRDSIEPLIARMEAEDGRLREDYARALGQITGRRFGPSPQAWRKFWDASKEGFRIPTDEELATLEKTRAERQAQYEAAAVYHGIETSSHSIVFVIDVSGSMEALVVERDRFKDRGYPSYARIDIVKTELARTLERLEKDVNFNVLSFATAVHPWKAKLVPANPVTIGAAIDWVRQLQALGGNSKNELASAGLTSAANLEAGKTNTYGALLAALGAEGKDRQAYEVDVDTIFFLSDGRPSHGEFVETDDILREIKALNALRKVVIHTIAIGEFEKDFMRELAESSGGVFVDLGK